MPDPRLDLTAQDLTYAARGLRVLGRQAERQATDPTFHASREVFGEAARAYDELAGKFERIAEGLSKDGLRNRDIPAVIRRTP